MPILEITEDDVREHKVSVLTAVKYAFSQLRGDCINAILEFVFTSITAAILNIKTNKD